MSNDWFYLRNSCPACGSVYFKEIYKSEFNQPPLDNYLKEFYGYQGGIDFRYLDDATYCLCSCEDCDLIFQKEIPNEDLMEILYESWIDPEIALTRHKSNSTLDFYYKYSYKLTNYISYFNKDPAELKFLDFGMGWGDWALMAKAFGCQSFGIELSSERIRHANYNGINILDKDTILEHQFDFINAEQVFEHLAKPYDTLCELKKVLKPNGIIKISVPKTKKLNRKLEKIDWNNFAVSLNAIAPLEHINCYRNSSLLIMANRAKMKELLLPFDNRYGRKKTLKDTIKNMFNSTRSKYLNKKNHTFFQNIA